MINICIVHFQPIEKYPPTVNLIRQVEQSAMPENVILISTALLTSPKKTDEKKKIKKYCFGYVTDSMSRISRLWAYFTFNWNVLRLLLKYRPTRILYFETLSSGSPWVYKLLFNKRVKIFIHYHEYVSPGEYKKGMLLNKWLHKLESRNYQNANWISQTNAERRELFLQDEKNCNPASVHLLPNYPPANWPILAKAVVVKKEVRIGFVYVGALDLENMYCREAAYFIANQPDLYFWDIYSNNFSKGVKEFFNKLNSPNICFKGSLPYEELPLVLPKYQVGLILYKGHIPNYIFNIPNKLYEYHVCGLDVWFPKQMKSALSMITHQTYPKIEPVNFEGLNKAGPAILSRSGFRYDKQLFSAETVLATLITRLFEEKK